MRRLAPVMVIAIVVTGCDMTAARSAAPGVASPLPSAVAAPSRAAQSTPAPVLTLAPVPAGRVAFIRSLDGDGGSEVFIANTDGSGELQLTTEGSASGDLVWAPDGSRLYFTEMRQQVCSPTYCYPRRVVSVRPDGTDRVHLGQIGAWGRVSVSPDRRFVSYPAGEGYPKNGGQSFMIPVQVLDLMTGELTQSSADGTFWSPDSTRLLGTAFGHISVVDVRSDERLVRIDDPWAVADGDVGWSPDGSSIYYHRCDPQANKDAAMACLAGPSWVVSLADPSLIARPNAGPEPPKGVLSPDGRLIASLKSDHVPAGLYLTPVSGGTARLVGRLELDAGSFEYAPCWSPDGQWLAVGAVGGIHLVPAAGGDPVVMALGAAPAWQPTGTG